jgi:NADPH:quinone reductase-like Zn-dependent oxidoreductase
VVAGPTLNRTDCGYRAGTPFIIRFWGGLRRPKSLAWGTEFAGEVAALGEGATRFAVGDRIVGWVDGTFGAHAEYLVVKETRLIVPIPAGRSYAEAPEVEGALSLGMLRKAKIGPGKDVLICSATGAIGAGVGGADMGAAVCPTAHVAMVKPHGADKVVDP